jgi:hypothetical protein
VAVHDHCTSSTQTSTGVPAARRVSWARSWPISHVGASALRCPPPAGGQRRERLAQGLPQREERYGLTKRIGGADGQRKPEAGRLADGVAQHGRLSNARFPLDQQHAADPALRMQQQVADQSLLSFTSVHGVHAIHDTGCRPLKQGMRDSINSWDL